ncbi:hypothetical protein L6452_08314 [Arctium lappa]|uniref:Uncharacterized protein n=1 Tax=Arctium lappa TaxID=4217 RepID=A0ACB9DHE7_ARCLA|nr:hypothetical protein L6452_08314 [Arctium lappa]
MHETKFRIACRCSYHLGQMFLLDSVSAVIFFSVSAVVNALFQLLHLSPPQNKISYQLDSPSQVFSSVFTTFEGSLDLLVEIFCLAEAPSTPLVSWHLGPLDNYSSKVAMGKVLDMFTLSCPALCAKSWKVWIGHQWVGLMRALTLMPYLIDCGTSPSL